MGAETVSAFWRSLTGSLGARFPIRFAIGSSVGTAVKILVHVLARSIPTAPAYIALDEFSAVWYLVVFVPLAFIPIIFGYGVVAEDTLHDISTLEAVVNRKEISTAERSKYWRSVAESVAARIAGNSLPRPHDDATP